MNHFRDISNFLGDESRNDKPKPFNQLVSFQNAIDQRFPLGNPTSGSVQDDELEQFANQLEQERAAEEAKKQQSQSEKPENRRISLPLLQQQEEGLEQQSLPLNPQISSFTPREAPKEDPPSSQKEPILGFQTSGLQESGLQTSGFEAHHRLQGSAESHPDYSQAEDLFQRESARETSGKQWISHSPYVQVSRGPFGQTEPSGLIRNQVTFEQESVEKPMQASLQKSSIKKLSTGNSHNKFGSAVGKSTKKMSQVISSKMRAFLSQQQVPKKDRVDALLKSSLIEVAAAFLEKKPLGVNQAEEIAMQVLSKRMLQAISFDHSSQMVSLIDSGLSDEQLKLFLTMLSQLIEGQEAVPPFGGLNFNGNSELTDGSLRALTDFCKHYPQIKVLSIERMKVSHASLAFLFAGLPNCRLAELNISGIPLNYHSVETLCTVLENSQPDLRTLHIRNTKLTDVSALKMMEHIIGVGHIIPAKIKYLSMSMNSQLGFKFQNELVKMLQEAATLVTESNTKHSFKSKRYFLKSIDLKFCNVSASNLKVINQLIYNNSHEDSDTGPSEGGKRRQRNLMSSLKSTKKANSGRSHSKAKSRSLSKRKSVKKAKQSIILTNYWRSQEPYYNSKVEDGNSQPKSPNMADAAQSKTQNISEFLPGKVGSTQQQVQNLKIGNRTGGTPFEVQPAPIAHSKASQKNGVLPKFDPPNEESLDENMVIQSMIIRESNDNLMKRLKKMHFLTGNSQSNDRNRNELLKENSSLLQSKLKALSKSYQRGQGKSLTDILNTGGGNKAKIEAGPHLVKPKSFDNLPSSSQARTFQILNKNIMKASIEGPPLKPTLDKAQNKKSPLSKKSKKMKKKTKSSFDSASHRPTCSMTSFVDPKQQKPFEGMDQTFQNLNLAAEPYIRQVTQEPSILAHKPSLSSVQQMVKRDRSEDLLDPKRAPNQYQNGFFEESIQKQAHHHPGASSQAALQNPTFQTTEGIQVYKPDPSTELKVPLKHSHQTSHLSMPFLSSENSAPYGQQQTSVQQQPQRLPNIMTAQGNLRNPSMSSSFLPEAQDSFNCRSQKLSLDQDAAGHMILAPQSSNQNFNEALSSIHYQQQPVQSFTNLPSSNQQRGPANIEIVNQMPTQISIPPPTQPNFTTANNLSSLQVLPEDGVVRFRSKERSNTSQGRKRSKSDKSKRRKSSAKALPSLREPRCMLKLNQRESSLSSKPVIAQERFKSVQNQQRRLSKMEISPKWTRSHGRYSSLPRSKSGLSSGQRGYTFSRSANSHHVNANSVERVLKLRQNDPPLRSRGGYRSISDHRKSIQSRRSIKVSKQQDSMPSQLARNLQLQRQKLGDFLNHRNSLPAFQTHQPATELLPTYLQGAHQRSWYDTNLSHDPSHFGSIMHNQSSSSLAHNLSQSQWGGHWASQAELPIERRRKLFQQQYYTKLSGSQQQTLSQQLQQAALPKASKKVKYIKRSRQKSRRQEYLNSFIKPQQQQGKPTKESTSAVTRQQQQKLRKVMSSSGQGLLKRPMDTQNSYLREFSRRQESVENNPLLLNVGQSFQQPDPLDYVAQEQPIQVPKVPAAATADLIEEENQFYKNYMKAKIRESENRSSSRMNSSTVSHSLKTGSLPSHVCQSVGEPRILEQDRTAIPQRNLQNLNSVQTTMPSSILNSNRPSAFQPQPFQPQQQQLQSQYANASNGVRAVDLLYLQQKQERFQINKPLPVSQQAPQQVQCSAPNCASCLSSLLAQQQHQPMMDQIVSGGADCIVNSSKNQSMRSDMEPVTNRPRDFFYQENFGPLYLNYIQQQLNESSNGPINRKEEKKEVPASDNSASTHVPKFALLERSLLSQRVDGDAESRDFLNQELSGNSYRQLPIDSRKILASRSGSSLQSKMSCSQVYGGPHKVTPPRQLLHSNSSPTQRMTLPMRHPLVEVSTVSQSYKNL